MGWLSVLLVVFAAQEPQFNLIDVDDNTYRGSILSCDNNTLVLATQSGEKHIELDAVSTIRRDHRTTLSVLRAPVQVVLIDGSQLFVVGFQLHDQRVTLKWADGQTAELPATAVKAVAFQRLGGKIATQWNRLLAQERKTDLLVIQREESLDYHPGLIRTVSDTIVEFEAAGRILPLSRSKIFGLVFYEADEPLASPPLCTVCFDDGSQLAASAFSVKDGQVVVTLCCGSKLQCPLVNLASVDFEHSRVVYLSELEPISTFWKPVFPVSDQTPDLAHFFAPRKDGDFLRRKLELGGKIYNKGLTLTCNTTVAYRIPKGVKRLHSVCGLASSATQLGQVELIIRGDGKVLWSGIIRAGEEPKELDIDLAGISRLEISVEAADSFQIGDWLILAGAKLLK